MHCCLIAYLLLFPISLSALLDLIPQPARLEMHSGYHRLSSHYHLLIACDHPDISLLKKYVRSYLPVAMTTDKNTPTLRFTIHDKILTKKEGYFLSVTPKEITIKTGSMEGAFRAVQTLYQLLYIAKMTTKRIACLSIDDYPRFSYRGLHLDTSRHMFPVQFIKRYIDLLALYKFNTFHWHLTDDQGWRIEIKKRPNLQKVGAYRTQTLLGLLSKGHQQFDGKRYGGYYTQKEISEIVRYAKERYITIIPEIELPGHCLAALASYPELGCTGGPYRTATAWGTFPDIYCPGKESTFSFLEDVVSEVMELFPDSMIHIGGDEVQLSRWKTCIHCQARMREESLQDCKALKSYFFQRVVQLLARHNKRVCCWDDALGSLSAGISSPIIFAWRGENKAHRAVIQGFPIVMCTHHHLYFDYYQRASQKEPLAIGGLSTIQGVYHYSIIPKQFSKSDKKRVLGGQGNLWTEYVKTPKHAEYMVYPRAIALAENLWTPFDHHNYRSFMRRLNRHLATNNSYKTSTNLLR